MATMPTVDVTLEQAVRERYSRGASETEPELCCPVDYDPRYLSVNQALKAEAEKLNLAQKGAE